MRVLSIVMEDPEVMIGGRGTHVKELYRAMAERGDVEIDLLTNGPGDSKMYMGYMKHPSDKLMAWKPPQPDITALFATDTQMFRKVMQLMASGKSWDIVHVHDWDTVQVGRAVRDALGIPVVGSLHLCMTSFWDGRVSQEILYTMQMEGHLVVDSDRIITCSHSYAKTLQELFLTDRPIDVVYNGIRMDEWEKRDVPRLGTRPVCLFVGRVAEMKGIREIIEVLEGEDTGYRFIIAGEVNADTEEQRAAWDVTQSLERIQKEHPSRLSWVGFQSHEKLKNLYSLADVVLMPSTHEPFGIVAIEAMAMGVPLIATEVDGLGEIVQDERGEYAMIIRPTPGDIRAALEELKDESKRRELIALGLKRAKDFTWERAASQVIDVYKETLHDRTNRSYYGSQSHTA